MNRRQFTLVIGCVICLLATAAVLPAADPRLDGWSGGDAVGEEAEPDQEAEEIDDSEPDTTSEDPYIDVRGALDAEATVEIVIRNDDADREVLFGPGEDASAETLRSEGQTETDGSSFTVPVADYATIRVPELDLSRTVPVTTEITLSVSYEDGAAIPASTAEVEAMVGENSLAGATVSLDGTERNTTTHDGTATVDLPESAGPVDLTVESEHGLTATETIEVAEIDVSTGWFLFPGAPTAVRVTAGGEPVAGATIEIGSSTTQTDGDGTARVRLPVAESATITASYGEETATTTVDNLFLRAGATILLVPGLVIGAVWSYLRIARRIESDSGSRNQSVAKPSLFVSIADLLGRLSFPSLSPSLERLTALRLPRVGSISLPSLPSLDTSGFTLASLFPNLGGFRGFSLPSLSLGQSEGAGLRSLLNREKREPEATEGDEDTAADETGNEKRREQAAEPAGGVYAAWHRFVDALGVADRERQTAGEIARHAIRRGVSASQVAQLVATFRAAEYGNKEPDPESAQAAHDTAETLTDQLEDDP